MKLLDMNVINYALSPGSPWQQWARQVIAEAVSGGGTTVNPVVLAELVTWMAPGSDAEAALKSFGVALVDLPAQAGPICGRRIGIT